jgi:2-polyprenyl-3-methyl-5-hydroxy-6-metoxy-1,4-benzoquinol methylase
VDRDETRATLQVDDLKQANEQTRLAWNRNARFWNNYMGEGNDFVRDLIWSPTERLLQLQAGEQVLDVACGNGLYARRLADLGGRVLAFDFSVNLVDLARKGSAESGNPIDYQVMDATNEEALLTLGINQFDAAVCNMALFDMAKIDPLMRALVKLLKKDGRFVFSVLHPCFNNPNAAHMAEMVDVGGNIITTYGMKVTGYMTPTVSKAVAIEGQPEAQLVFHRPLQDLFAAGFRAGFVMDALEERAFPADHEPGRNPLSWSGKYSEIPPVLVARMIKR